MQSVKQSPQRVGTSKSPSCTAVSVHVSGFCPRPTQGVAVHILLVVGLMFVLLARQAYAVQTTLAWDDPLNAPTNVVGYRLYYLRSGDQTPVRLDVGKQTPYTLTGLQAGQAYSYAVTAYNSAGESAASAAVGSPSPTPPPSTSRPV